jgi:hypothetical protein
MSQGNPPKFSGFSSGKTKNETHLTAVSSPQYQTPAEPHLCPLPPGGSGPVAHVYGADPRSGALAAALPGGRAEQPVEDLGQRNRSLRAVLLPLRVRYELSGIRPFAPH